MEGLGFDKDYWNWTRENVTVDDYIELQERQIERLRKERDEAKEWEKSHLERIDNLEARLKIAVSQRDEALERADKLREYTWWAEWKQALAERDEALKQITELEKRLTR